MPEIYYAKAVPTRDPVARIDQVENFFGSLGATIKHGGNRAYYAQELDYVQMPPFEAFRDAESYYATLAHELTHWTKHPQRLNRDFGHKSWGDEGYSHEELVAELGSAFLCADLELHQEPREDNAAYIATWLEVLKNDNRAIFAAAAHAQRAADYLNQRAAPQDAAYLTQIAAYPLMGAESSAEQPICDLTFPNEIRGPPDAGAVRRRPRRTFQALPLGLTHSVPTGNVVQSTFSSTRHTPS